MASWLAGTGFILFFGASLVAWLTAQQRWARGRRLLACEPRRPVPWGLLDIGAVLICLILLLGLVIQVAGTAIGLGAGRSWTRLSVAQRTTIMLIESLVNVVVVAIALAWLKLRTGASWNDIGVVAAKLRADIGLGVRAFIMLAPPVYLLQWLLVLWFESKHPLVELLRREPDPWTIGVSLFAAVCVAPVTEEFFFRGLLQGWLEKVARLMRAPPVVSRIPPVLNPDAPAADGSLASNVDEASSHWSQATELAKQDDTEVQLELGEEFSPADALAACRSEGDPGPGMADKPEPMGGTACTDVWPIVVSSLVFALLHWSHGPDWVPLFFLALGLGYLYRQTHRIVPGIIVHFLLNAVSMGMFLVEIATQGATG